MNKKTETCTLLLILCCFFLAHVLLYYLSFSRNPSSLYSPDSSKYLRLAENLSERGLFSVNGSDPETFRVPGYPLFLSLVFTLCGKQPHAVIIAQIFLNTVTAALLYLIARTMFGARAGFFAVILFACNFASIMYSQKILSETLFTCFLTGAVLCFSYMLYHPPLRNTYGFAFGLCIACATMVRPVSVFLPVPIIIGLLPARKLLGLSAKQAAALALCIAVPWIACTGGWKMRNYILTGCADFSDVASYNILMYNAAHIIAERDNTTVLQARKAIAQNPDIKKPASRKERNNAYLDQGLRIIRQHPLLFIATQLKGMGNMLPAPCISGMYSMMGIQSGRHHPVRDALRMSSAAYMKKWLVGRPVLFALCAVSYAAFFLTYTGIAAALWALIRSPAGKSACHVFLVYVAAYFFILTGALGYARFSVPVMPVFCLYAAYGNTVLIQKIRTQKWSHS
jgi:4-amino-4-deoxy-L-arabinose transferase-like glycosyltransferase